MKLMLIHITSVFVLSGFFHTVNAAQKQDFSIDLRLGDVNCIEGVRCEYPIHESAVPEPTLPRPPSIIFRKDWDIGCHGIVCVKPKFESSIISATH